MTIKVSPKHKQGLWLCDLLF